MAQAPGQTQTPGQTQGAQTAPGAQGAPGPQGAQAGPPRRPARTPPPAVPPEFDALPIWKMDPPKLVAMLKDPNSTVFQKAIACKKLAFTGGPEAVAPMAALLSHPELACYARFGLEPNPHPSVDDALRAALPKLKGKLQVGVITSIGVRKDAKALDALSRLIDDSDPEVAGAAAASAGMIGGLQAAKVLQSALGRTKVPVFPVVARATLLCAEGLMANNRARALELYAQLSDTTMPKPVRWAAIRVLNAAGPAPAGAKDYPPPTGEAAERDRSGFLGRDR
ncbi:MAG TPA: HEAT repeat domain-containing protein [Bryobacteraceae bacterium]|nr:HEAT repeat domain-containing protein [Bryobacteraceae bacterium]